MIALEPHQCKSVSSKTLKTGYILSHAETTWRLKVFDRLRSLGLWFWQPDKLLHILISLIMVQAMSPFISMCLSMLIAFGVGGAKEVWDWRFGSGFCWNDILANFLGVITGAILLSLNT